MAVLLLDSPRTAGCRVYIATSVLLQVVCREAHSKSPNFLSDLRASHDVCATRPCSQTLRLAGVFPPVTVNSICVASLPTPRDRIIEKDTTCALLLPHFFSFNARFSIAQARSFSLTLSRSPLCSFVNQVTNLVLTLNV